MSRLTRREMLLRSAALGCSLAASPLVTPISLAAGPWDNRLVLIILRGGMDGVDAVRPVGDPAYAAHRRQMGPGLPLDGFFEAHPALAPIMPLWQAGQLSFVHATSTPYRDKRSHFDGQDHLEAGFSSPDLGPVRDGWLNRLLQQTPGAEGDFAYSIGQGEMLLTRGAAEVSRWSPAIDLAMSPQALRLAELVMHDDPLFQPVFQQAVHIASSDGDAVAMTEGMQGDASNMMGEMMANMRGGARDTDIAAFAADRLRGDTRIAAFSLNGWDTHQRQDVLLGRALARLADVIVTLRDGLQQTWQKTTVVVMTEFGRTLRLNGTGGSDHGTGGAMILAGGALRRAQVAGHWPGLDEADLYARRDLMPTSDVRAHAAWALHHALGAPKTLLETQVFAGLDMGDDPGLFA